MKESGFLSHYQLRLYQCTHSTAVVRESQSVTFFVFICAFFVLVKLLLSCSFLCAACNFSVLCF